MLTIEQIRAGRALLDWSQSDLADHAGLSQTGIARIENGTNKPNSKTLQKIMAAFDGANIGFLGTTGVEIKPEGRVNTYSGEAGFVKFLEQVYETLKNKQTPQEVVVNNVSEDDFLRWEGHYADEHQKRMAEIQAKFKIITKQGDQNFTASEYAEYRWVSEHVFSSISYYIYADYAALINFENDNVTVYEIHSSAIANFYREEFEKTWNNANTPTE